MVKKSFIKLFCGIMLLFTPLALSQTIVCQWASAAETDTDVVADVQNALNNAGYDCGTADGVAGSKTTAAISQYQEDNGLAVSGTIDEGLLISLGMAGPTMNGVTGDTDFVTSDSELVMTGYEIGSDYNDQDALILYFTYTNSASTGRFAMLDFYLKVYQNGISRDYAIPAYQASWQEANNNSTKDIKDGASLDIAFGYVLENTSDPVEIEVQEDVNFNDTWSFSIDLTEGYDGIPNGASDEPVNSQAETQAPEQAETEIPETASDSSNPDEENEPVSETELETELITEQEIQTEENRTVYAPATVLTGTIVEATMNTITVQTDDGTTYLCATEDTEFNLVNGGITLGMEVEVTLDDTSSDEYGLFTADYVTDMAEDEETEAVETETETELVTEPEIQTEEDRTVYAPDTVLTGTIVEATMNTITLQTDDENTYICATEDTEFNLASGGISLGMEVEVILDDTTSDEYGLFQAKTIKEEDTSEDVDAQSEDVDLFDDVFVYLAGQIDEATYQDGISYLDSCGVEYDADPPEDGYSGMITTSKDVDGFKVIAFFSENYSMQDTLNLVAYSNGEYEVSVDDNYHTSGTVYNVFQKNATVQNMKVGSLAELETFIHTDLPEIMNGNDSSEYLKASASTGTNYKLKYGDLVSTSESKSDAGDVLIVKAKITSSYSNEATIDQNYKNVFDLIQNQGCSKYDEIQYWAVADMSSGEESKVVSFTLNKDLIQKIADDKIIDITLGDYVEDLYIHNSLRE